MAEPTRPEDPETTEAKMGKDAGDMFTWKQGRNVRACEL